MIPGRPGRLRIARAVVRGAIVVGCASAARSARADDTRDAAMAQALFEQGRQLLLRGEVAEACPMFAESQRLDPGGGTLLNLALCHERLGRLATAWAEYHEALSAAIRDAREDRRSLARERIDALGPRLPSLAVVAGGRPPPGLVVRVDASPLGASALGIAAPIDPGMHDVVASAPGRAAWSVRVAIGEGEAKTVTLPELELDTAVAEAPRAKRLATGAYVAGAVVIPAAVTATTTGVLALVAAHAANATCVPNRAYCPGSADDASRARTLAWVSTASLGVAAAALVVAVAWPRETVPAPRAAFSAGVVPGGAAARVDVRF